MGKRHRAREMAVQMLYQGEHGDAAVEEIFAAFDIADYLRETEAAAGEPAAAVPKALLAEAREAFTYARELVAGTHRHREEIDELIRRQAENWRLERMPTLDRNVLRLAVYEMLYQEGVPKVVIVDEAIELAKRFGSENSGRFVNGLLDGMLKARRLAGRGDDGEAGTAESASESASEATEVRS